MSSVVNAVDSTVDELSTDRAPAFVHTFASCHPLRNAQGSLSVGGQVLTVSAASYEAIHSVHSAYLI